MPTRPGSGTPRSRQACQREPLPEPQFPSSKDLIGIANPRGPRAGIEGVNQWLLKHKLW
jgi:hypothetical protein